jgi:hypothetical protein
LRRAVDATLATRSFTIEITDSASGIRSTESFVYEASERCEYTFYANLAQAGREEPYRVLQIVTIGRLQYWRNDASDLWSASRLVDATFCANWQDVWITPLEESTDVTRTSLDTYRSYAPELIVQRTFGATGKYAEVVTTVLRDGKVISVGIATSFVDHLDPVRRTAISQQQITIGAFGMSPPVIAPPARDVSASQSG